VSWLLARLFVERDAAAVVVLLGEVAADKARFGVPRDDDDEAVVVVVVAADDGSAAAAAAAVIGLEGGGINLELLGR